MIKAPQVYLDEISAQLEKGEFAAALLTLHAVDRQFLKALSQIDRSRYHFLHAWCMFGLAQYGGAMVRVRCALRLCRLSSDHVLFAREATAWDDLSSPGSGS